MGQSAMAIHRSMHPLLQKVGVPKEVCDHWSEMVDQGGYSSVLSSHHRWSSVFVYLPSTTTTTFRFLIVFNGIELKYLSPPTWLRFVAAWARRREGDGLPAPPLSIDTSKSLNTKKVETAPYPGLHIFRTPEEAAEDMTIRAERFGDEPYAFVRKTWEKMQKSE